tara:strand:- start:606 stop:1262 length:657 start_codon:yes stop_codon:yes gene_type:complete
VAHQYRFNTTLTGYVQVARDAGKFNNRTFAYTIPPEPLEQIEEDRRELIKWARSKATGRVQEAMTPWDKEGVCKYTYGSGHGTRKPRPEPEWVGADNKPLTIEQLEELRAGTPVEIEILQKPYAMGSNVGTSLSVVKVKCLEVSGGGRRQPVASPIDRPTPLDNPMQRTLSDLVGSAVVFDLQQLLETYLPVVGSEGRNELIATIRREANEYLDQEQI